MTQTLRRIQEKKSHILAYILVGNTDNKKVIKQNILDDRWRGNARQEYEGKVKVSDILISMIKDASQRR